MQKKEAIEQYLQAEYRLFPVNGKISSVKNWQKTRLNPFLSIEDFPNNFGICLQPDDLVIDIDVGVNKNGTEKQGRSSFNKLAKDICYDFKDTFAVKTGGGGFHFYFKKPPDLKIREKWYKYPDIEFKSTGRYVVGAEGVHPDTKKRYIIVQGQIDKLQNAPTKLLDLIKYTPIDFTKTSGINQYADDVQSINRCKAFLERAEPATREAGGDLHTYKIACRCRSFGLSPQATYDLLLKVWSPRCNPPWDPDKLKVKVYNAYQYDQVPLGEKSPESDFNKIPVKKNYVWVSPPRKDGTRAGVLKHCVNYLDIEAPLRGLFKYNLFTKDIEFTRRPIWYAPDEKITPWSDTDAVQLKFHLSSTQKFDVPTNIIHEGALIESMNKPYHPLRDYLNTLVWDKKERIGNWLTTYCGVQENAYSKTVGLKVLLAAIARVFDPGCKFDNVLVIEGDQGAGKSRLLEALGKDWYGDLHLDPHNKDTVAAMRNKWVIEISEMEMVRKAEINAMKAFLSRSEDRVRLSHRKNAEDFPRQCIFIGTINPDDSGGYLRDTTGNRRFWPVLIPRGVKVKVEKMQEDVDQIWAETISVYKSGIRNLHIEDEAVVILAEAEAEKRRPKDPWLWIVKEWVSTTDINEGIKMHLTSTEIFTNCLDGSKTHFNRPEQTRISQIMKELGWTKGTFYCHKRGKTVAGFSRPKNDLEIL